MDKGPEKIKEWLLSEPSVILAYLFGSRVKGTANRRSDWDLGIYFTQNSLDTDPWHDFIIGAELSKILKADTQIVVLNKLLPPLLGFEIVSKGCLLANKDEDLRLDYENKVSRFYYDWTYFYRDLQHTKINSSIAA